MKDILKIYISVVLSLILVTVFLAVRLPEEEDVHFHANFAIFTNGQKLDFSDQKFMHIESCANDDSNDDHSAKVFGDRIHLEDGVGDVAHIHDSGVVWGDLMLYLRSKVTADGIYFDGKKIAVGNNQKITYYINGQAVEGFEQRDIRSNDTLLIVLGDKRSKVVEDSKAELNKLTAELSNRSEEFNMSGSEEDCGGSVELSFWKRVARVWGF